MNGQIDFEGNKRATVWIVILVVAVALILCYAIAATAGAMAFYPPVRTLVYGLVATDLPTPLPGTLPTRIRPTAAAVNAPSDVAVQSGLSGDATSIYDFAPDWQELTSPGMNNWDISFTYDQPVSLDTGWCTSTSDVLEANFRHITFLLQVDSQDVPVADLLWTDGPGNDGVCRSYSGYVQAWPLGPHTVVMTMRLDQAINDGWNDFAAGDYVDRFNLTVTP